MKHHFNIVLERVTDNSVEVRFYSEYKLDLRINQIKAYYQQRASDSYPVEMTVVYLDNNAVVKSFSGFPKHISEYSSLNFIVKDSTNRSQLAVQIPLNGAEAKFTPMVYGET